MALIDEVRMDRTVLSVVKMTDPSDQTAYWQSKTMQERWEALELTRQVFNNYDPDTTRFQRVLELVARTGGQRQGSGQHQGGNTKHAGKLHGTGS